MDKDLQVNLNENAENVLALVGGHRYVLSLVLEGFVAKEHLSGRSLC